MAKETGEKVRETLEAVSKVVVGTDFTIRELKLEGTNTGSVHSVLNNAKCLTEGEKIRTQGGGPLNTWIRQFDPMAQLDECNTVMAKQTRFPIYPNDCRSCRYNRSGTTFCPMLDTFRQKQWEEVKRLKKESKSD